MTDAELKELCLSFMKADTEEEVVQLLKDAGYWDDPDVWRNYGDTEGNYSKAGAQADNAEAALVEKLTNSRDARLMNACRERDIEPEGSDAPKSLKQAVAQFFEENPDSVTAGLIREWTDSKRTEVARGITLAVTGATPGDGYPCFTIADCGEGQTPDTMPTTLLSLNESIKMNIPFVHGRFNMGGTAVLRFCGSRHLQLVLSRRNPAILDEPAGKDSQWGFTVVKRNFPKGKRGGSTYVGASIYKYLAPIGAKDKPGEGGVLRFSSDSMPIFPEGRNAYARESEWGTLIKLYEYRTSYRTSMFRDGGILRPLDLLLPDIGLPVRLYECRSSYKGHKGSFETTLNGLIVRLHDDKDKSLEQDFPTSHPMRIDGNPLSVTVYAFKVGKASTYRKASEGILVTLNGQTQGLLSGRFFDRKRVGMSYLKDSLLVIVDCSAFDDVAIENFFMNSRDRMSKGEFRYKVERVLEKLLHEHKGLKDLKDKRRREKKAERLDDSNLLEKVLESVLKHSPTLSQIFLRGEHLSNPFKTDKVITKKDTFEGKPFPTYFKFKKVDYGKTLHRNCHINRGCRIAFETDAANDYFGPRIDPGEFSLFLINGEHRSLVENSVLNLHNGIGTLSLELPSNCCIGDELHFLAVVTDLTRLDFVNPPFENHFVLHVLKQAKLSEGGTSERKDPPGEKEGNEREAASGLKLPVPTEVYESPREGGRTWEEMEPSFDKYTALRIISAGVSDDKDNALITYDFYINMDNLYLNTEIKTNNRDADITASQFQTGMVLLGLSFIHHEAQVEKEKAKQNGVDQMNEEDSMTLEEKVEEFTKAAALVLLPMIEELSDLDLEHELVDTAE
ncbi:MAG: hypothetical protein O7D34_09395 [Ignavibacteria bacterium]|nr:hypothetical protein [Ignavibacteria bacterium]